MSITTAVDRAIDDLERFAAIAESNDALVRDVRHLNMLLQVERRMHGQALDVAQAEAKRLQSVIGIEREAFRDMTAAAAAVQDLPGLLREVVDALQDHGHAQVLRREAERLVGSMEHVG